MPSSASTTRTGGTRPGLRLSGRGRDAPTRRTGVGSFRGQVSAQAAASSASFLTCTGLPESWDSGGCRGLRVSRTSDRLREAAHIWRDFCGRASFCRRPVRARAATTRGVAAKSISSPPSLTKEPSRIRVQLSRHCGTDWGFFPTYCTNARGESSPNAMCFWPSTIIIVERV